MAWVACPCGDPWCETHGMHAFECPCPPVDEEVMPDRCTGPKCRLSAYALGLCRGHYTQQTRGTALHPLRDEGAPARVVLSLRVTAEAKARASADPEGARRAVERWAKK